MQQATYQTAVLVEGKYPESASDDELK